MNKISILFLALFLTGCDFSDIEKITDKTKKVADGFSSIGQKINDSVSSVDVPLPDDKYKDKVENALSDKSLITDKLLSSDKLSSLADKAKKSLVDLGTSSVRDAIDHQVDQRLHVVKSGNHQTTDISIPSEQSMSHLEHLLIAFKAVANGQEFNTSRNGQNAIKIHPEQLYPVSGSYSDRTVNKRSAAIVWFNEANTADQWRCYAVTQEVNVQRDNLGLTINGQVQEYAYIPGHTDCSNQKLAQYTFDHAHINNALKIQDGEIKIQPARDSSYTLNASSLLLTLFNNQNSKLFGPAWAAMQLPYLANAVEEDSELFVYNSRNNTVTVNPDAPTDAIIPFESLNKAELLSGQLFNGSTDSGIASKDWCKIVNIPYGTNESQQYQAVIAMNCARATPRWCDYAGGNFSAGVYPATHTISWNSALIAGAMENSRAMKSKNKQGHFAVRNSAQNAFLIELDNAIAPIFGYTTQRTDGYNNNSGTNSWTGHAGHCQNVMSKEMHSFAVSWLPNDKSGIRSYWTQDFAR